MENTEEEGLEQEEEEEEEEEEEQQQQELVANPISISDKDQQVQNEYSSSISDEETENTDQADDSTRNQFDGDSQMDNEKEEEDIIQMDSDFTDDDDEEDDEEMDESEIDSMLEQGFPRSKRLDKSDGRVEAQKSSKPEERGPHNNELIIKKIVVLEEKGGNTFEVLPGGWIQVRHCSGMPLYLHRKTRVCTMAKPYYLGPASVRRHSVPLSAIPCLSYRRALEKETQERECLDGDITELENSKVVNSTEQNSSGFEKNTRAKAKDGRSKCPSGSVDSIAEKLRKFKRKLGIDKKEAESAKRDKKDDSSKVDGNTSDDQSPIGTNQPSNRQTKNNALNQGSLKSKKDTPKEDVHAGKRAEPEDGQVDISSDDDDESAIAPANLSSELMDTDSTNLIVSMVNDKDCEELHKPNSDSGTQDNDKDAKSDENKLGKSKKDENYTENHVKEKEPDKSSEDLRSKTNNKSSSGQKSGHKNTAVRALIPLAKVETARENASLYSVLPLDLREYCKPLFKFTEVECKRFKTWSARRKHTKEQKRRQLERPTLPENAQVIKFFGVKGDVKKFNDYVFNPRGKSSVCILHEFVQHALRKQPTYSFQELENAATPYAATVMINEIPYGKGLGSSKKTAKAEAARNTLTILIPQMKDQLNDNKTDTNSDFDITEYFQQVEMNDVRIPHMCSSVSEPSPYTLLLTCLQRNFGQSGSSNVKFEMIPCSPSKGNPPNQFRMTAGNKEVVVSASNKREGKQLASQLLLKEIHPHIHNFGAFIKMYGNGSIKSVKEKKQEEQQITTLQSKASANSPNWAILNKLRHEMLKLAEQEREGKSSSSGNANHAEANGSNYGQISSVESDATNDVSYN